MTISYTPVLLTHPNSLAGDVAWVREANRWVNVNIYFYNPSFFSPSVIQGGKQSGFSKCLLSLRQFSSVSRLSTRIHSSALEQMKQMNNLVIGY